ncbi:MAG: hypothetical protein IKO85_06945 [Bacteroidaceae bacterium]|nr:hypothetical protein [Bacteroidaceae bacterium]
MKEIQNNQEIPIPEGLEQRLSALVDRLEAEEQGRKNERMKNEKNKRLFISLAIAAAFVAVAFLLIVPQVRERQQLALYEGSYTLIDGQRIDDLGQIKADISEALAMAQMAEANVPAGDFASQTERAILQATDDPEMQAVVQRILGEN